MSSGVAPSETPRTSYNVKRWKLSSSSSLSCGLVSYGLLGSYSGIWGFVELVGEWFCDDVGELSMFTQLIGVRKLDLVSMGKGGPVHVSGSGSTIKFNHYGVHCHLLRWC
jgi:hypothetical protein